MEWTRVELISLIEMYQNQPVLWDQNNVYYKNKIKRINAWREISETLCIEKTELEKKIRSLTGQFQRELKREAEEVVYSSKWFAFELLQFLSDKTKRVAVRASNIEKGGTEAGENPLRVKEEEENSEEIPQEPDKMDIPVYLGLEGNEMPSLNRRRDEIYRTSLQERPQINGSRKRNNDYSGLPEAACKGMTNLQRQRHIANDVEPDQYKLFGDWVVHKIRVLPTEYARNTAEYHINNILYRASLGEFNYPFLSRPTPPPT